MRKPYLEKSCKRIWILGQVEHLEITRKWNTNVEGRSVNAEKATDLGETKK